MEREHSEADRVRILAKEIRHLSATLNQGDTEGGGGCCYVTLSNGKRECFDWDGLSRKDCEKIGEQAGLPSQFLPGKKCEL